MYCDALLAPENKPIAAVRAKPLDATRVQRKQLVAFDGSPAAMAALDYAIERARASHGIIHVVNVQVAFVDDVFVYRIHKHEGEQVLKPAIARLKASGVPFTTEVGFGSAAEAIVRAASQEDCDVIVMGTRERTGVAGFFSPSVSGRVVRLSRVPVTVVKHKVVATTHEPRYAAAAASPLQT
jgi:nucleotide-binding universal stress UspA family protein